MLKNIFVYLTVLLCSVVFFICFDGYLSLYVLRLVLLLPVVSIMLALPCVFLTRLKLTAANSTASRGAELTIRLCVSSPLSVYSGRCRVTLTVKNKMTGEICREQLALPFGRRSVVMVHKLSSAHCGIVECRLSKLRIYDPMGLFGFPVLLGKNSTCAAAFYPAVHYPNIGVADVPTPDFDSERYSLTRPGNDPAELFDLREYREGDKLSRINWKLSEKADSIIVKEFSSPAADSTLLLFEPADDPTSVDCLLDALATLSTFLSDSDLPHFIGFWSKAEGFAVERINTGEELASVLYQLMSSCKTADKLLFDDLPLGVSHAVYLCGMPNEAVAETLYRCMPCARISILSTDEATSQTLTADMNYLHLQAPETDLKGFEL